MLRGIVAGVMVLMYWVVGAWLEIGGVAHAFIGHGTKSGVVAMLIPPVAWYRSVEFFWHRKSYPPITADHPAITQTDSIREVLMLTAGVGDQLGRISSDSSQTASTLPLISENVKQIQLVSTVTLNSTYPGWGTVLAEHWLPGMHALIRILRHDQGATDARTALADAVGHISLYDNWLTANRAQLMEALKQKGIIEAYADSAGTVH